MSGIPASEALPTETLLAEDLLERGEVFFHPIAPFPLPQGEDRAFLLTQQVRRRSSKNISYNPQTRQITGFVWQSDEQAERLRSLLEGFSQGVIAWLAEALPHYRGACEPDRASLRPEEEATRRLRSNARNDLLHIDAFPNRPARGRRILRVYANINPTDPRVWAIAEPLPRLLSRYGKRVERIRPGFFQKLAARMLNLLHPPQERPSKSDLFMLRLHDYLKRNVRFQQKGQRKLWKFPPDSAWLAMTDGCCHAELRGQFALEHSFFIAPQALVRPELSPEALLEGA